MALRTTLVHATDDDDDDDDDVAGLIMEDAVAMQDTKGVSAENARVTGFR